MTTATDTPGRDMSPTAASGDVAGMGARDALDAPALSKCCGAYLRPCDNLTDTILCAACYDVIDRTLNPTRNRAASETRRVYRRRAKRAA